MRVAVCAVSLLAAAAVASAEPPIQGGYSTAPLAKAVIDPARVAVEAASFNEWLNVNHASLGAERMKGPREHLYSLIDSWVKMLYARDHVVLPAGPDLVLATYFAWAERLGVYGGRLIHARVKPPETPDAPAVLPVPAGFALALEKDTLVLRSEAGGWSVAFPYYFMLWQLAEFDAKGGSRTQLVGLSTGVARHEGQDGHSQATLMLMFGPGADPAAYAAYWGKQLGFSGSEPEQELGVRGVKSRRRFDEAQKLHHEYTSWSSAKGPIVVAYLGLDGTYQWNRPHFVDFVRAIQER